MKSGTDDTQRTRTAPAALGGWGGIYRAREEAWRNPFPSATPESCIAALEEVVRSIGGDAVPHRIMVAAAFCSWGTQLALSCVANG
jgi:hypothetical protein